MRKISTMRSFVSLLALFLVSCLHAQSGIRAIPWNIEPVFDEKGGEMTHYGLGYDRDLNDRLSLGVDFRILAVGTWTAEYRCQYHFADNTSSSFYMGSTLGVRSIGDHYSKVLLPIGIRMGVRGGLEGFYADLYVGGKYQLGANGSAVRVDGITYPGFHTTTFVAGLDIGFGWDRR